ncbi:sensor histidine kinase [Hathewaya histolytica]|uniref:sensor histidine kinase n=1 Tax=Hathewaya histolytica TaxID=1498 RepID=UPI003B66B6A4
MTFLLNNLVLMIQIDNNDFNLNKESVDLKKLLKNKTEEFNMICKLKKINLNVIYKECTMYEHIFDKILFERVIDNLLYNSVKFTPKGGNINIIFEEDKDKIHFIFSDTGEGFNKKMLDKYFNKFYKKDKVSNKGDEHFGLGLYTSKNIIEKHDGNICIGNNEQGGALIEGFIKTS